MRSGQRYVVGVISDITERKRMEKDLVAAKLKSEDANRAKSMFLADMSHELRTPLNSVIGFAEIIKNELLGAINEPRYRDYVGDIHSSGKRLLLLINDILDMTKVEAGTYQLREDVCDVAEIVGDAIALVQNLAIQNELTVRVDMPQDIPFLFADERGVRQVLVNFLSNAIKFTPKGGDSRCPHGSSRMARSRLPSSIPALAWRRTTSRRRSVRSSSWRARTPGSTKGPGSACR